MKAETRLVPATPSSLLYLARGHRRLAKSLGGMLAINLVNEARRLEREADKMEQAEPKQMEAQR